MSKIQDSVCDSGTARWLGGCWFWVIGDTGEG